MMILLQGEIAWSADNQDETVTLEVLPLEIVRTGPYSYLGNSIGQMLITRFSGLEKLDVSSSQPSEAALENLRLDLKTGDFRSVVNDLGVDWVADGSVYSLKNGIKMNLTLYPGAQGVEPALFGITAAKPEDILPAISGLTADIGRLLTGIDEKQEGEAKPPQDDGMAAFKTPHPELAYKKGIYSTGGLTGDQTDRFSATGVRRSSSIPMAVESMVLADLNSDGNNELIVASRDEIRIFQYGESRFDQVAAYSFNLNKKIHALSILSGNPTRLIVSADDEKLPSSAVLSWDGSKTLQLEHDNIRWYIRAISRPGKDDIIAGQRPEPDTGTGNWELAPEVYRLERDAQADRLSRADRLMLPDQTKLFDFVYADINGDSRVETVVIDDRQKLLVYNDTNELLWVSSADYGGGLSFFGQPLSASEGNDEAEGRLLEYLPGRLEVKDIDGNGIPEIIINTNTVDTILRYFPNLKFFDGGSVACLGWTDDGLKELWRTNKITGYVADYAFEKAETTGTASRNGTGRLFLAQAEEKSILQNFFTGSDTTRIFAYEMLVAPPKED